MNEDNMTGLNGNTQADVDEMKGKYLTFWTDSQLFGVPIADVVQIVGMQRITIIPEYPYYAKGIINLRGSIIPVIDVRLRLNKPESEYTDHTCIIVTSVNNALFGFIVDEVDEVTPSIADEQISIPPRMGDSVNQYLTGIARLQGNDSKEEIVLLIDTAKILGEDEFQALMQAVN